MVTATTLNSSVNGVGLSAAEPGQIAATKDTLDKSFADTPARAAPEENKESTRVNISAKARELSAAEQRAIAQLQRIDAEVRAHEEAHLRAGRGVVTGGPNYTYTTGPDGRQYATSGEVGIDTGPEREPRANINKGQRIQEAALAPAQPSPQDYQVAAVGSQLETQGRTDLAAELRADQAQREATEAERAETAADAEAASARAEAQREANSSEPPLGSSTDTPTGNPADSPKTTEKPPTPPAQAYAEQSAAGIRRENTQLSLRA